MRPLRLAAPVLVAVALVACGGSDSAESETIEESSASAPVEEAPVQTDVPEVADEPVATVAPVETDAPVETEVAVEPEATPVGEVIEASLLEWAIEAPTEYAAGAITFTASNGGSFPHELVVIRGDGYASLPQSDGGSVLEDELDDGALIARTSRLGGGETADLVVDLEPGNYVLLCNLGGGANSHAGRGQVLDITVG